MSAAQSGAEDTMRNILKAGHEFVSKTRPTNGMLIAMTMAIAASTGAVARAGKPTTPPPVTVSIADSQGGVALNIRSDGRNETALGGTYFNNVDGVQSIIQNGELWLQTYYTSKNKLLSPRTVAIDLDVTEGIPPFVTPATVPALVQTRCGKVGGTTLTAIPFNQIAACGFFIRFLGSDNQWYRLAMNTENWPTTSTDVNVKCTGTWDSSGCTSWTITPIPGTDPNPKALAQLLRTDSGGNVLDVLGTYHVSFAFNVTR